MPFHRQHATVIGERVNDNGCVFACFDDFIEIADAAATHGVRERSVDPHRFVVGDQIAADEIGGSEIVMTRYGDERALQAPCHVFDEACLAASGRTFEQYGDLARVGGLE